MIPLIAAAPMRELDAATIAAGLPAFTLMETAGRGVADAVASTSPRPGRVAVVCGGGGNGGDGFVAARVLRDRGVEVVVYVAVEPPVDSAAGAHRALYLRTGGREALVRSPAELEAVRRELVTTDLVLDGLFGVGLARPVAGHLATVIDVMNAAPLRWAIDIPSGLDADRGVPLGACVRAQVTVSLGRPKLGVVTAPGFAYAGELRLVDIGLPKLLLDAAPVAARLLEDSDCAPLLPLGSPLDHKGSRGHVLVVGGGAGMRGAAELAASAALRVGAGLCTWAALADASAGELRARELAVMARVLTGPQDLGALAKDKAAWCVGPGLGRDAAGAALLAQVLACTEAGIGSSPPALVLDADALFHLAGAQRHLGAHRAVVTPHPKEAARLLRRTVDEVEADRMSAAQQLAEQLGAIAVLKGARTIICDGELAWICAAGSPALATAGSGDVLAGAIAGLCAQGLAPLHAALVAVQVHGHAGRRLADELGPRGVVASDLPAQLGRELARLARR